MSGWVTVTAFPGLKGCDHKCIKQENACNHALGTALVGGGDGTMNFGQFALCAHGAAGPPATVNDS